jgi:hypothetical protein
MLSHLEADDSAKSMAEIQASIQSDQLTMAAHCAFMNNIRTQGEQDRAAGARFTSHVLEAVHLLEPWTGLREEFQERLIEKFPHQLAEAPTVPPDVRARCCAAVLGDPDAYDVQVPEVTAVAPWALRLRYGRIYGTGDPRLAPRVVVHIMHQPYTEEEEVEAYAALRKILTPEPASGEESPVPSVGIIVALPEPDPQSPQGSEYGAVYDALRAAAVGFADTPLTISTHESGREYGQNLVSDLNRDRTAATFTAFASYEPILATAAGMASQRQPDSVPGMHLIPQVRVRSAQEAAAARRGLSELHERPWQVVLASKPGNRRTPGLN